MSNISHFIWYELITSDLDAAITFYGEVVGWDVNKSPTPGMDYRIIHAGETGIGGMMATPEGAAGMPSFWVGYVNVDDVDKSVSAIEAAGGKVAWPANTIPGVGRLAMLHDPQGAAFYVMAPQGPDGASTAFSGDRGHCGWNEYHAKDWQAAFDFYAAQFGWTKDTAMDMGPMGTYQTFKAGDVQTGGMMNNPLPQQAWLFYFNVDNIDAAAGRVTAAGGAIQMGPIDVPGGQWAVVARDPQGAMFGLLGSRP